MRNLLFVLLAFIAISFSCNTELVEGKKEAQAKEINESQKETKGRKLKEISLSGSGYELGLQHGKALKKEIEEIVLKWKENTSMASGKDADLVLEEFFQYAQFTEAIKKWTPDLYEEVRGIAEGSGQAFNDIFVLNLLDEFWVYVNKLSNHHCSDVGVPSINGGPSFVAQNMDIESYTDGYQTLIRLERNEQRPEQLLLTHPGLIVLNGMNEKGVGVCVNTLMQLKASNKGLPVAFIIRKIINTTDKETLLDFIKSVNHASGQNYIIGIRGEVFDFEASANKVVRFDPGNENGTVYHTNHPLVNDDLKEWFKEFDPKLAVDLQPRNSNSHLRFESIKQRMTSDPEVNDKHIKEALRSKDDENNPVCRNNSPGSFGFTFGSVILSLSGLPYMQITAGPPDESEFKRIDFSESKVISSKN